MRHNSLTERIPDGWRRALGDALDAPYLDELARFVEEERAQHPVYPPHEQVFAALEATPLEEVRVLLLGQDPYYGPGQAHGLAFSVAPGVRPPPSLVNIFQELESDVGCSRPKQGDLLPWAHEGVLLLNTVLTVRGGEPGSHRRKGWERFTDAVFQRVNDKPERVVFLLWGADAQKKKKLVDTSRHVVLESVHPSPLSAHRGFFGCCHFSKTNAALEEAGRGTIDWCVIGR